MGQNSSTRRRQAQLEVQEEEAVQTSGLQVHEPAESSLSAAEHPPTLPKSIHIEEQHPSKQIVDVASSDRLEESVVLETSSVSSSLITSTSSALPSLTSVTQAIEPNTLSDLTCATYVEVISLPTEPPAAPDSDLSSASPTSPTSPTSPMNDLIEPGLAKDSAEQIEADALSSTPPDLQPEASQAPELLFEAQPLDDMMFSEADIEEMQKQVIYVSTGSLISIKERYDSLIRSKRCAKSVIAVYNARKRRLEQEERQKNNLGKKSVHWSEEVLATPLAPKKKVRRISYVDLYDSSPVR